MALEVFRYLHMNLFLQTFQPETTDIYDKKNMPKLIYCIHALSTHLFKLGRAPQIQDLYGKINFTGEPKTKFLKFSIKKHFLYYIT